MKTTIITVTYDKDLEFLKYNLKSIKKFCNQYHGNVVVIDDHKDDCLQTQKYLESIGQKYFVNKEAKLIKRGYIRQQYIKMYSDMYVPKDCNYICHIDSDSLFKKTHTPDRFFRDGKPIMIKNLYKKLIPHLKSQRVDTQGLEKWQQTTSRIVGFDVDYEFMFRMPLVYPKDLFRKTREYLEKKHNRDSLVEVLKDIPIMSEYNILGAFAHRFMYDDFFWIDRWETPMLIPETGYEDVFGHYSNREFSQPDRYIDLSKSGNELERIVNS